MLALALIAIALAAASYYFAHNTSRPGSRMMREVLGVGALLIGVVLILRGAAFPGVAIASVGVGLLASSLSLSAGHKGGSEKGGRGSRPRHQAMSRAEAAQILDVAETASEAEIQAAYRQKMKSEHPDAGGSDARAAKVAQARDVLLGKR